MSTLAPSRTQTLATIMAKAYQTVPAHWLQVTSPGTHRRVDFTRAYDTAVTELSDAGFHRDTLPAYVVEAMDQLFHAAKGTSPGARPVRQQQMHASLLAANATSLLLIAG